MLFCSVMWLLCKVFLVKKIKIRSVQFLVNQNSSLLNFTEDPVTERSLKLQIIQRLEKCHYYKELFMLLVIFLKALWKKNQLEWYTKITYKKLILQSTTDLKGLQLLQHFFTLYLLPIRTTGQLFLHSWRHFFGLHLSWLTIAILVNLSAIMHNLGLNTYTNYKEE